MLFDPDRMVRQPARRTLGKRGFAELAGPAQEVVDYNLDERLSDFPLQSWTAIYGRADGTMISSFKNKQSTFREAAAWMAGVFQRRDVLEQLTEALQDEQFKVRRGAAWSLGMLGGEGVPEALTEALADEEGRVRVMAAWALAKLGDDRGFESLADLLADPDARSATQAAEMLGRLDGQQAVGLLLAALEDERPAVRGFGVIALRPFLNGKQAEVIRKSLDSMANDKSAFVRAAVDAVDFDRQ
jgi:HEAT repeat protein